MGTMRKWVVRIGRAAAVSAAVMLSASLASAQDIQLLDQVAAESVISPLMQPISPFINGDAQTTTSITQIGEGNFASSGVTGESNLAAIEQSGSRNRAVQAIEGHNSAMLLVQGGTNNNVLQASRGDNNFQLVGVSGNNNSVGYVQVGDNLAGALDVTNASNSTVVALQTPDSGTFSDADGAARAAEYRGGHRSRQNVRHSKIALACAREWVRLICRRHWEIVKCCGSL